VSMRSSSVASWRRENHAESRCGSPGRSARPLPAPDRSGRSAGSAVGEPHRSDRRGLFRPGQPAVLPAHPPTDRSGLSGRTDMDRGRLSGPAPGPDREPATTRLAAGVRWHFRRRALPAGRPPSAVGGHHRTGSSTGRLVDLHTGFRHAWPLVRLRGRGPRPGPTRALPRGPPPHLCLVRFAPSRVPAASGFSAECPGDDVRDRLQRRPGACRGAAAGNEYRVRGIQQTGPVAGVSRCLVVRSRTLRKDET
jgi:hypothetical protein